jgi:SM-20-related protein
MTAKQLLDAFSETLMQDERILSPRERELLVSLLQNSKTSSSSSPESQAAVNATIARSVGETVAQRAFELLGGSIVEQILASSGISAVTQETMPATMVEYGLGSHPTGPQPPQAPGPGVRRPPNKDLPTGPQPPQAPGPGVRRPPDKDLPTGPQPPQAPGPGVRRPPDKDLPAGPQPPQAPGPGVRRPPDKDLPAGPQPPQGSQGLGVRHGLRPFSVPLQQGAQPSHLDSGSGVGVLDAPPIVGAQCVVLDEFLAPQELDELVHYALEHEAEFQSSAVVSPNGDPGVIDYNHRRSRVLMDLGKHEQVILERIRCVLPKVLDQIGIEEFPVTDVEAQITASNDGDFFGAHSDDSEETIASRRVTFVYFFHREPRQFEGGELRLHDSPGSERHLTTGSYQTIMPQQNQIVFFPCSRLHEITQVECPSRAFADSRFTLNGWLHN